MAFRVRTGAVALALGAALLAGGAHAQALSLGEQFALRGYTGQAFGSVMADLMKVDSPLILTNQTSICSSLAGAMAAQLVAKGGHPSVVATAKPEEASAAVQGHANAPALALIYGGQASVEDNYAMVKAALQEAAKVNYTGPIFFHLRVWGAKLPERAAKEDAAVAAYLARKDNLYTATVNAQDGKALVHQVAVNAEGQKSARVLQEVAMHPRWLGLFRRSI
ncbi:hypothetical protein Talka_01011 [Tepidimonas alkaliphilus]|uniref:Uncharacterized protein n=1 Tax=Tepidimonas alkaliphilus TaxID=2588942 RepID=A0A554W964_9BURK|nr:hypothetical protein [Tepidimonas alkaliphilus]TSE20117.1 hypothetical protein Talka_01011 [Tepidimonas alkaliphilus]